MDVIEKIKNVMKSQGIYCWGRGCKLGWGYNSYLGLLIPVEKELTNVALETENYWGYGCPLESIDIPDRVKFLLAH